MWPAEARIRMRSPKTRPPPPELRARQSRARSQTPKHRQRAASHRILLDQFVFEHFSGVGTRQLRLKRDRPRTLVVRQPLSQPADQLIGELAGRVRGIDGL